MLETVLNDMLYEKSELMFRNAKARCIQTYWRNIIANPYHPVGIRRLIREASELDQEVI